MNTPLTYLQKWEQEQPNKLFLRQPVRGDWRQWTWSEAAKEIRSIAAYLRGLNLPEHSNIVILSKNCAHWILADFAIWSAGHVSVPIYPTLHGADLKHILEHSEAKVIFLGKLDEFEKQKDGIPESLHRISFPEYGPGEGRNWNELLQIPATNLPSPSPEDLATIIYTSGTTGKPKGVMITFAALDYVTASAVKEMKLDPQGERFFSYLPLGHIAERMLIEMGCLYTGGSISFAESLQTFSQNLGDTKPTVFLAVPRIWSKMQEKILEKLPQKKLDRILAIPVLRTIVKNKIRKNLGLSNARWIFSGAAPIRASLLEWFGRIGIVIHEAYGMTENVSYSHGNINRVRYGSAGHKWPGVEERFSEEGELLVRHSGMMKGYFKEPELTAECFTSDGFLKTGDVGVVDDDGFLKITGRVKDYFKTDKGKYIAPTAIELTLLKNPLLEQACLVGTGLPQPMVLVTLSATGKTFDRSKVAAELEKAVRETNRELQSFEEIEKVVVLKDDWTVDNGYLTPTLKVKRNKVEGRFRELYGEWFQQPAFVVWE